MKKHWIALLLAMSIIVPTVSSFADDDGKDKDKPQKTDAAEMSLLGLAVASALGAGSYLVYRRRGRSRG